MALMASEHLALATDGLGAVFAVVVDLHFMFLADFFLGFMIDELVDNGDEFVDKTIAAGHHRDTLDLLPAIGALGLELQTLLYAVLAIELGAEWAHHGAVHVAKAHMASQQILELVPRILHWMGYCIFGDAGGLGLFIGQLVDHERVHFCYLSLLIMCKLIICNLSNLSTFESSLNRSWLVEEGR